ncbi:MAG: hypothetical protein RLY87_858 [Chloroflexota bacterium]
MSSLIPVFREKIPDLLRHRDPLIAEEHGVASTSAISLDAVFLTIPSPFIGLWVSGAHVHFSPVIFLSYAASWYCLSGVIAAGQMSLFFYTGAAHARVKILTHGACE